MSHNSRRRGSMVALFTLALLAPPVVAQQAVPDIQAATENAVTDNPVPKLLVNLESDNVRVAASAARSLGVIFSPGGEGSPEELANVTEQLIAKLESALGGDLREESARALGRMKAASALEGIKTAIDDEDIEVAVAAAEAAASILPVDQAREFLKARGADQSQQVKAAVYQALSDIAKAEDADFLAAGLTVDNWRAQEGAVEGLERAVRAGATLNSETYDNIAAVLGAETLNAANAAVHFLTHIRNDESLRATIAAVDTRGDGSSQDESWRTRAMALKAVRHLGWPTNQPCLPAVVRQLGDPVANVSNQARNILYHLKKEHFVSQQDLFPLLLTELEKSESLSQKAGIMREMGSHVDRQYASRVAQSAAQALLEASEDKPQWPARAYATRLVGASGYTGEMEAVAKGVADDIANVRQAAGDALADLAPLVEPEQSLAVADILQPLLVSPVDWRKTAVAARAAGYYPTAAAVEPLTRLLSHSVVNVKSASGDALAQFAAEGDDELQASVKQATFDELARNPQAWQYGAKVLGALNDPDAVPLLTTILQRGDWRSQASAADATAAIAKNHALGSKELSDTLVKVAQSEVLQVQDAANGALRAIKQQ